MTNSKVLPISDIEETSCQFNDINEKEIAVSSKNNGSIKNKNQTRNAVPNPARNPFLFPWGQ